MALAWFAACGSVEGPLIRELDSGDAAQFGPDAAPAALDPRVRPGMRLHYQVSGELAPSRDAQLVVSDLFDTETSQLAELRASGRVVIAYLSAGTLEPWRPDVGSLPDAVVGAKLASYPNEAWLDIRSSAVRKLMRARLALARDKGFDGVFPGSLSGYRNTSGFALSASDQRSFDLYLAAQAHELGLSVGLSGDFELLGELADAFDWAIAFGCLAANSCAELQPMIQRGKAVFDVETEGTLTEICARASGSNIVTLLKRPSYDAWSQPCS
jgi:hypothetical protein